MNIKPLGDRLIIERIEQDEKTSGGIIIPDNAKEKPKQGKVLAVGAGAKDENGKRIPMDVEEGDIVLFSRWAGGENNEIQIDGKTYIVLKEEDVLGIVENAKASKRAA